MFIRKWFQAPKYVQATIIISMGGCLFGLDTGTIGPLTTMPQFTTTFGTLTSTIHGLIVSTILLPAALSSFFGGHLANTLGRLRGVAIGASIFGLGAAIEGSSVALSMLFVGRAVKGIGEGLFMSTSVVYITEISPASKRGTLASIPQLLTAAGLCAGYFICYGTVELEESMAWRIPFILQACIAAVFTVCVLLSMPESPRWLNAVGRHTHAVEAYEKLGIEAAEREKLEVGAGAALPEGVKMRDILSVFNRDARTQTWLGVFMMGMQQASGIDGVLYYAPLLFASAGLSSSSASFLASGISALLMFLITIPGTYYADAWGRRTSTIAGGLGIAFCMFVMGILYASNSVHADKGAARWVVVVMIYLFALCFNGTWAITFRVYVNEIQSPKTRAGASSLSLSANWVVNWIVAFTTPILLEKSSSAVYWLYGGCAMVTVGVCWWIMPETRGKKLEDIDEGFRKARGARGGNGDGEVGEIELSGFGGFGGRGEEGKEADVNVVGVSSSE